MEPHPFPALLAAHGYSMTRPRQQLFAALQRQPAVTLQQLITDLPDQHPATVYRTVALFEKLGIITRLQLGWHSKLELSDSFQRHHHHFSCLNCGQVTEIPADAVIERRIQRLSQQAGFAASDHQLEIRGRCHACSAAGS